MDIIAQAARTGETYIVHGTGNREANDLIQDLRREVESGRTRWFAVVGAGVETPDILTAIDGAAFTLYR